MKDRITLTGRIGFDPQDKTNKHLIQSSWKKIAMVFIEGDVCEYYAWFIEKRYSIVLNKPLRGGHISFINDSMSDLSLDGTRTTEEIEAVWKATKKKWDGKKIEIVLDLNPRTDDKSWWLNIPNEEREGLQAIRNELGLGRPYFGMHMSIGYARPGIMEEHSKYIHESIKQGFIK